MKHRSTYAYRAVRDRHQLARLSACAAVLVCAWTALARAQDNPPPAAAESPPPAATPPGESPRQAAPPARRGPADRAELETFVDGIMAVHLRDKHIAGATIAVVVDDQVFFSKGYGYADAAHKTPVNPRQTRFRIGSVSKLFTWTAVMQLVEQGKLDLSTDINQYLKEFKIPNTQPGPITLKHLLTHTPGFEDQVIGLFGRDSSSLRPLGDVLARELPSRIWAPGELASYSNHGTALAGYIVAQVSGVPWEDYIEQNLLTPLEMSHTSVRQPAADKLPAEMSKGYRFEKGEFREQGFEYVPAAPAGSMSASAVDMANFMIAHLQDGRFQSQRILQEDTARQMRQLLFTHDPRLDGMAYGFMRMTYNGEQIVHHGGDTFWFHTDFVMLPERHAGYFVSYNSEGAGGVRQELFRALLDRYYPAPETPAPRALPGFSERAAKYRGTYQMVRHSYTSVAKLAAVLAVGTVDSDGDVLVLSAPGAPTLRFVEVEPLLFHEVDGQEKLLFREDADGRVTHLIVGSFPVVPLVAAPWYETPTFTAALLGGCIGLFLSAIVGWPIAAFLKRGGHVHGAKPTGVSRLASVLGWIASVAVVVWLSAMLLSLTEPREVAYGLSPELARLLSLTPVLAGLFFVMLACVLLAWMKRYWPFTGRLHYTCVALAGVAFVWFLYHWNLLWGGA